MASGFIKLHRKMTEWEWYTDIPTRILFEHCLLKANYKPKKWRGVTVELGSFITSYEKLAQQTGLTIQQVRTAINKLKSTNEITHKTTSHYSIISINNWVNYQDDNTQDNKQTTDNQQTNNKQITTTKNIKNDKNEENNIVDILETKRFKKPTLKEIEDYCIERKNNVDARYFFDYYESCNWMRGKTRMKDWKATIRTWERNAVRNNNNNKPELKEIDGWNL